MNLNFDIDLNEIKSTIIKEQMLKKSGVSRPPLYEINSSIIGHLIENGIDFSQFFYV